MSVGPYKGVRDFYPEDERIQNHIFGAMRRAVESFGYEEMNASVLEYTELYSAKTSEEIVNEQTYTFEDRGGRMVTLRPEMTPTVARMVAAKKRELGFPLRWYSIQNFFRYERPQRGRLREFWQLNADLFGVAGREADVEVIEVAHRILRELGASEEDFTIRIGSRAFLDATYDRLGIPAEDRARLTRLLDGKEKGADVPQELIAALEEPASFGYFSELQNALRARGIQNAVIDPSIARGFDYYTGMVFEVFDTNKENPRSMFGGGRYDNLIGQYGKENAPAVGFAMGDVIARDFLETHGLMPHLTSSAELYLAPVSESDAESAAKLADELRGKGLHVALGMGHTKIADHIKAAIKLAVPCFAAYGEEEKKTGTLSVKDLASEKETRLPIAEVAAYIRKG
jgi:histidyl-tRNA synthetase